MYCYDPDEQTFTSNDRVIGMDWGKRGDKTIQTTVEKNEDGNWTITDHKELDKGKDEET